MVDVHTTDELSVIKASGAAVVYVHVNWSVQSRQSDRVVASFERNMLERHGTLFLPFYRVEVSDQTPLWEAAREWLGDRLIDSGSGALVWLRDGKIVRSTIWAAAHTVEELLELTVQSFAEN